MENVHDRQTPRARGLARAGSGWGAMGRPAWWGKENRAGSPVWLLRYSGDTKATEVQALNEWSLWHVNQISRKYLLKSQKQNLAFSFQKQSGVITE